MPAFWCLNGVSRWMCGKAVVVWKNAIFFRFPLTSMHFTFLRVDDKRYAPRIFRSRFKVWLGRAGRTCVDGILISRIVFDWEPLQDLPILCGWTLGGPIRRFNEIGKTNDRKTSDLALWHDTAHFSKYMLGFISKALGFCILVTEFFPSAQNGKTANSLYETSCNQSLRDSYR